MIQIWSGAWALGAFMAPSAQAANVDTILGTIDGVVDDGSGAVVVRGWACWKGWSGTSPQVDLYVGGGRDSGGVKIGTYSTGQPGEQAISDVCETNNTAHRFVINLTISLRQQYPGKSIYIYGVPYPGLSNYTQLGGSGQYTVPSAPAVANSVYYIHTDRLGSNVIMTDANANVVAKTDYKAYGEAEQQSSKQEAPGYTGGYEDPLTGLTYMQARYYDADLGRFISIDPVGVSAGDVYNFNRYAYANNNPLSFTDPMGMAAQALCAPTVTVGNTTSGGQKTSCGSSGGGGGGIPSFGGTGGGSHGGGGGIPGGGASPDGTATAPAINVTANRPPDIPEPITFTGLSLQSAALGSYMNGLFGGWSRFIRLFQRGEINVSIGVGVEGQVVPDYADAEVGVAFDANATVCLYGSGSTGAGLGGVWGAGGPSMGIGVGALTSGTQTSYGTYWQGGDGFFGEGKVNYYPGGGYARGLGGFSVSATGGSMGGGAFVNKTVYKCSKL
jgi:RHS repeat-associated protein